MLKAISLFAGAGGCSLGFTSTRKYKILSAYDNNEHAVETYNKNFGKKNAHVLDLSTCDYNEILRNNNLQKGELDIIIGGPPCQGFSTAGTRFWDDPRNKLIINYAHALDVIRPRWFLMENVEGILTSGNGEILIQAVQKFAEYGYSLVLQKIYAQEYGVPQRRKRVIIIGNRTGAKITFPLAKYPIGGPIFRNSQFTLYHSIHDLEEISNPLIDHTPRFETGINYDRICALKQGQTMKDLPEHLQHESFKKRANRRVMDGTPTEKRGGAPSGLKRLVYDEPCLTITSASTREFIHPTKDRALTIRECARIQTFPDSFLFTGTDSEKIQQIGNAIPPLLGEIFANHISSIDSHDIPNKPGLVSFELTKAEAMSPALENTRKMLSELCIYKEGDLFNGSY